MQHLRTATIVSFESVRKHESVENLANTGESSERCEDSMAMFITLMIEHASCQFALPSDCKFFDSDLLRAGISCRICTLVAKAVSTCKAAALTE